MAEVKWLELARSLVGLKEIPGPKHSTVIQGWLTKLKAWWQDDETPWCGTFVAHCLQESGQPIIKNWFRAKEWLSYGEGLPFHRLCPGAILVFARSGGGHVGFYVGEDKTYFSVLGGNQSNAVNIMRIEKARCIGARWPKGVPVVGGPVKIAAGKVSKNEA
jgi:uncharacterized protein (TIGR02594 family)